MISTRSKKQEMAQTASVPAVVAGEDIHTRALDSGAPGSEAHERFGGFDPGAVAGGALAGVGALTLSGVTALGASGYLGGIETEPSFAEAMVGCGVAGVVLGVSGLVAGWVCGRIARYDGARNGVVVGSLMCLVMAFFIASIVGAGSVLADMLSVLGESPEAAAALVASALVLTLALAALGARRGTTWHGRVDRVVSRTRAGGLGVVAAPVPAAETTAQPTQQAATTKPVVARTPASTKPVVAKPTAALADPYPSATRSRTPSTRSGGPRSGSGTSR